MAKINLDKEESDLLNKTIHHWETEGLIDTETAEKLYSSYEIKGFDWKGLAKNSFAIALVLGIIAMASFIINDAILNWLKRLYDIPNIIISVISAVLAAFFFYEGSKRKRKYPERVFSNETIIFFGVLLTASCIAFLAKTFDNGRGHFSVLFLLANFVYALLAVKMRSDLLWAFALISLGLWFGTETGYQTNWHPYFLRMNYPLRFVFFGVILALLSFPMRRVNRVNIFRNLTYTIGLIYFFISLWLLSIFGNFGSFTDWTNAKQMELYYWEISSILISIGAIAYGLIRKDIIAREFGIVFLLVNLYSRYFEYLWGVIDKSIFFSFLAISFWLIGRKAEKIWNLEIFKK